MSAMNIEEVKRLVGRTAVDQLVRSGMRVGMGTGSTAVWAVRRIGELLAEGSLRDIVGVSTSTQAETECHELGIPLRSLNDPDVRGKLDLTIDGADEVDRELRLTKGGGGALLLEKVVAYNSETVAIVTDSSKLVPRLGDTFAIPCEVSAMARVPVTRALEALGGEVRIREADRKMGFVITDNGNMLLDVRFPEPFDPRDMEAELLRIPGLLENGLFTRLRPLVFVASEDGVVRRYRENTDTCEEIPADRID
jgi:ribose 5-phosphate isomerase A